MKMIALDERQCFVMLVIILHCKQMDMSVEFELTIDDYSHVVYMNYRSREITRSVPLVHFPSSFRKHGRGVFP